MKIYTIPEFELYYHNEYKRNKQPLALWQTLPIERFNLNMKKVVKKRKTEVVPGKFEIPTLLTVDPKVTKDAFNTNRFNDLIVAYFRSVHNSQSFRRISSEGRYRPSLGRFIKGLNRGMEDLQGMVNGRLVAVETKSPKDRMGDDQIKRMNVVRADGGIYIIGQDFEQIQRDYYEAINS